MRISSFRALAGAAALAIIVGTAQADTPPDTLILAERIDGIIGFDPAEVFEIATGGISNNLYLRLVQRDEQDQDRIVGGAAESWTVSDDGLTFTFKMRPDVVFASGAPVTAEDAAFSLQRVVKLNKSPAFILTQFGWSEENVEEMVRAEGADTLILTLDKPLAPSLVLNALSAGVGSVVEKAVALQHETDGDLGHGWLSTNSAGAGPFILRDWRPNEVVVIEANDQYYQGAPRLERMIFRHVAEPASQQLMLEKGDVDIARNLGSDQLKALAGNPDIKIETQPKATVLYLGMNTTLPELADPKVQQAIRLLIDYEGIANTLLEGLYQAHQSVLTGGGALTDNPHSFDPERARQLLAEAGQENLSLEIDVYSSSPFREIGEAMQADFAKGGVKLDIIASDNRQALTKYRARNHDLTVARWSPDYGDPNSTIDFFVTNPDNSDESAVKTAAWRNGWLSPEAQDLAENAMFERDAEKRAEMYAEIQRILRDESPMMAMFQQIESTAMRKTVDGWISGPSFDTYVYRSITK